MFDHLATFQKRRAGKNQPIRNGIIIDVTSHLVACHVIISAVIRKKRYVGSLCLVVCPVLATERFAWKTHCWGKILDRLAGA